MLTCILSIHTHLEEANIPHTIGKLEVVGERKEVLKHGTLCNIHFRIFCIAMHNKLNISMYIFRVI